MLRYGQLMCEEVKSRGEESKHSQVSRHLKAADHNITLPPRHRSWLSVFLTQTTGKLIKSILFQELEVRNSIGLAVIAFHIFKSHFPDGGKFLASQERSDSGQHSKTVRAAQSRFSYVLPLAILSRWGLEDKLTARMEWA